MLKLALNGLLVSPSVSLAVQVTFVVPIGNVDPDADEQWTVTVERSSSTAVGRV